MHLRLLTLFLNIEWVIVYMLCVFHAYFSVFVLQCISLYVYMSMCFILFICFVCVCVCVVCVCVHE